MSAISVGEVGSDWTSLGGLYGRLAVSDANILVKDVHNGMFFLLQKKTLCKFIVL